MSQNGKPKLAMYWAAACGGCEIAVLNIGEKILDVDAAFDVAFWPVAMDAKYKDVEAMPDGSITLTLFNGGIRNEENEYMAGLLRDKSQILVAFGSCASEGCIPGLADQRVRRLPLARRLEQSPARRTRDGIADGRLIDEPLAALRAFRKVFGHRGPRSQVWEFHVF